MKEKKFLCILKVPEERSRIRRWIRIWIRQSQVRMRIRIRTKNSRISNTGHLTWVLIYREAHVGSYLPYIGTATILCMVGTISTQITTFRILVQLSVCNASYNAQCKQEEVDYVLDPAEENIIECPFSFNLTVFTDRKFLEPLRDLELYSGRTKYSVRTKYSAQPYRRQYL